MSASILCADKPGPIYDFDWSPFGQEFVVVYGMMPAKGVWLYVVIFEYVHTNRAQLLPTVASTTTTTTTSTSINTETPTHKHTQTNTLTHKHTENDGSTKAVSSREVVEVRLAVVGLPCLVHIC